MEISFIPEKDRYKFKKTRTDKIKGCISYTLRKECPYLELFWYVFS